MDYNNWNNGDIVRVKSNLVVEHYAVFFRDESNNAMFIHNTPSRGVKIDPQDVFWNDREFLSLHYSLISGIGIDELRKRILSIGEKNYSLFSYDCEDFVSELTGNRLKRKQILKYMAITSLSVMIITFAFFKIKQNYK